jgi:hypothetical protein
VADALDVRLYVAAAKRGVLGCIGLSAAHASRLTTNHLDTNYHVVRGLVGVGRRSADPDWGLIQEHQGVQLLECTVAC